MHLTHSKYPDFTPPVAGPPLFEIGGLSHAYPDGTQALSDINLTVYEGDRIALVGKNVTDEKFLQEVIPAPEFGGAFIHPGAERRVSIEVGYKF